MSCGDRKHSEAPPAGCSGPGSYPSTVGDWGGGFHLPAQSGQLNVLVTPYFEIKYLWAGQQFGIKNCFYCSVTNNNKKINKCIYSALGSVSSTFYTLQNNPFKVCALLSLLNLPLLLWTRCSLISYIRNLTPQNDLISRGLAPESQAPGCCMHAHAERQEIACFLSYRFQWRKHILMSRRQPASNSEGSLSRGLGLGSFSSQTVCPVCGT